VLFAAIMMATGCVTTGGNRGGAGSEGSGAIASATGSKQVHGRIEINENSEVAPELREQFDSAVALLEEGNYPEAVALFRKVAGQTSRFSAPYINLGIAYSHMGEMEKAEESLQKALGINGRHPVALNELGVVYRKSGRYQDAQVMYETVLSMYPEFLPALKNLGILCDIYLQDLECAYRAYDEYLKIAPGDEKVEIWVADLKRRV